MIDNLSDVKISLQDINVDDDLYKQLQESIQDTYQRKDISSYEYLKLLLWKNYLIFRTNSRSMIFLLVGPIIVCLFIVFMQYLEYQRSDIPILNPEIKQLKSIPNCKKFKSFSPDCISIGIFLNGYEEPWVNFVVEYLKKQNNFDDNDVKILEQQVFLVNNTNEYLANNPGKVQVAVEFCTFISYYPYKYGDLQFLPVTCNTNITFYTDENLRNKYTFPRGYWYQIYENMSNANSHAADMNNLPWPVNQQTVALKLQIDKAIISYESKISGKRSPEIQALYSNFPTVTSRFFQNNDLISMIGAFFFFLMPMFLFLTFQSEIVREKQYKLRYGLLIIGVGNTVYWLSWIITSFIFSLFLSIYTIVLGNIFQFQFFTQTSFLVLFMLFFYFTISMQFLTFLIATFVSNLKESNSVSYAFVLFSAVIEVFISSPGLIAYFYMDDVPSWVKYFLIVMSLYPPYNYSKVFSDISSKSGYHWDMHQNQWVLGPGYFLSDLTEKQSGKFIGDKTYDKPTSLFSLNLLLVDLILYFVLSWYFDHVIESNRGVSQPFYFLFTRQFWCKKRTPKQSYIIEPIIQTQESYENSNVELERIKVLKNQKKNIMGIRINDLSKTFKLKRCLITQKEIKALNHVFLEVPAGELCCILGHNGAGKTTLINILTGILSYQQGEVTINNKDLRQDIEEIRKEISFCPQFDILWEDLTAAEHLELFARIKGIDQIHIQDLISQKLEEVQLTKFRNAIVKTYSGGMKRRLSIAICSVGDPKIIYLDEPTTGMDPVSKRFVWKLIEQLKKDKAIIMTTHSMDEADILSDRLAVLVEGQLKCIGNSLYLKNQFGGGYRIQIVVYDEIQVQIMKNELPQFIKSAQIQDCSGTQLIFGIPITEYKQISIFFDLMEIDIDMIQDQKLLKFRKLIKDWGLSHATLEEVFMTVNGKKIKKDYK